MVIQAEHPITLTAKSYFPKEVHITVSFEEKHDNLLGLLKNWRWRRDSLL